MPGGRSDICSPLGLDEFKRSSSCFTKDALMEMAKSWNRLHPDKPQINTTSGRLSQAALRKKLQQLLGPDEGEWITKVGGMSQNAKAALMVMPQKPKEWIKQPRKWLNNYDITHILTRFEGDTQHPYKLLGVFPIDFQGNDASGQPLYPDMHDFQLSKYVDKYKYMGIITNLDDHDGPGTHWTSTFIVIDPSLASFGAYYYDSTFTSRTDVSRVPPEIRTFFKLLKRQAAALYPTAKPFKNVFYKLSHQKGNTECGMFSIFYQVHWLRSLVNNIGTTHKDIITLKITDDQVFKLRDFFFRPPPK